MILKAKAVKNNIVYRSLLDFNKVMEEVEGREIDVKITAAVKDSEKAAMYAYYQVVLIPLGIRALTKDGWAQVDEYAVDHYYKSNCAKAVLYNKDDDTEMPYTLEKRAMNKERLNKFLNDCVWLLEERHEIVAPDSKEYKMKRTTNTTDNFKKIK